MLPYKELTNWQYIRCVFGRAIRMSVGHWLMRAGSRILWPLMTGRTRALFACVCVSFTEDIAAETKEMHAQTHNRFNRG